MTSMEKDGTIFSLLGSDTSDEESMADFPVEEEVAENVNTSTTDMSYGSNSFTDSESEEDSFSDIYDAKLKLGNEESHLDKDVLGNTATKPSNTYYNVTINNMGLAPINCNPDIITSQRDGDWRLEIGDGPSSGNQGTENCPDSVRYLELGEEEIEVTSCESAHEETTKGSHYHKTSVGQQTDPGYHQITDKDVSCCGFKYSLHEELQISDYHQYQYHPKHNSFKLMICGFMIIFFIISYHIIIMGVMLAVVHHSEHYGNDNCHGIKPVDLDDKNSSKGESIIIDKITSTAINLEDVKDKELDKGIEDDDDDDVPLGEVEEATKDEL